MKSDFIRELGPLAIAVRMKRAADMMMHSGRMLYRELGLDIEPNWYLIFLLLKKQGELSITEMAEQLRFAHPSIVTMVQKLKEKGYLQSLTDSNDSRKQLVKLTPKAKRNLPEFERVWEAGKEAIVELLDDEDVFSHQLDGMEDKLIQKDYKERTLSKLK